MTDTAPHLQRLTQPDWCNAPQPANWRNACMRSPEHDGDHAVRKVYRWDEAWFWPADDGYPVSYCAADRFPDLWDVATSGQPPTDDDGGNGPGPSDERAASASNRGDA